MNKNTFIPALCLSVLMFTSCKKEVPVNSTFQYTAKESIEELVISPTFDYTTTREVSARIEALSNSNEGLEKVRVEIFRGNPDEGGKLVQSGATDESGVFETLLSLPSSEENLFVRTHYLGLPRISELYITGQNAFLTLGGVKSSGKYSGEESESGQRYSGSYQTLGTWNNKGVPNYLTQQRDAVDQDFLNRINATLPEQRPVPTYHPDYLAEGVDTETKLYEEADVWVTFVHEGAGWLNSLGFYTYDLNNPPASLSDVSVKTIIFPNFSYQNSGGGLYSGDKVHLGRFPANTGIGWFVIAQGWSNGQLTNGTYVLYSNPAFNPETDPSKQQHNVLVYDEIKDVMLLGFEDIRRDVNGCDNDFNDAIFYVSVNPPSAVDVSSIAPIDLPVDTDGDGISDVFDDFPNDPAKAFRYFYPAENSFGTLAFEDCWPGKGDYDMNDLVVGYNYEQISNPQNKVTSMIARFSVNAVGAAYENGFGFQMNCTPNTISSINGQQLTEGIINTAGNGTETGQAKAVVIVFDNANKVVNRPTGNLFNTKPGTGKEQIDTIVLQINMSSPQTISNLGIAPFNPFLIRDKERGKEIHLPDYLPTDKADYTIFKTFHDNTDVLTGQTYTSLTHLPWGLHLPGKFDHPTEKSSLLQAYPDFGRWVESNGTQSIDWYTNAASNNPVHIFK